MYSFLLEGMDQGTLGQFQSFRARLSPPSSPLVPGTPWPGQPMIIDQASRFSLPGRPVEQVPLATQHVYVVQAYTQDIVAPGWRMLSRDTWYRSFLPRWVDYDPNKIYTNSTEASAKHQELCSAISGMAQGEEGWGPGQRETPRTIIKMLKRPASGGTWAVAIECDIPRGSNRTIYTRF